MTQTKNVSLRATITKTVYDTIGDYLDPRDLFYNSLTPYAFGKPIFSDEYNNRADWKIEDFMDQTDPVLCMLCKKNYGHSYDGKSNMLINSEYELTCICEKCIKESYQEYIYESR